MNLCRDTNCTGSLLYKKPRRKKKMENAMETNLAGGLAEEQLKELEEGFGDDFDIEDDEEGIEGNETHTEEDDEGEEGSEDGETDPEDTGDGNEDEDGAEEDDDNEEEGEEETDSEPEYEVKHLGKTVKITGKDIIPTLQKGMDYDHIRNDRDSLLDVLGFYAAQEGMETRDYIKALTENRQGAVAEAQFQKLKEQYPDAPEQLLKESANQYAKNLMADTMAKQKATERAGQERMLQRFVNKFPDVKPEDIPAEVMDAVKRGADLTDEYTAYSLEQANKKIAELEAEKERSAKNQKKNKENKNKATKSVKGAATTESQFNDFINGFDED